MRERRWRACSASCLGVYVSRWWRWAVGGLPDLQPSLTPLPHTIARARQQAQAKG